MAQIIGKASIAANLLITVPLLLSYLGKELFGVWVTLTTVVSFFWLVDLGIGNALVNLMSEMLGKRQFAKARETVSTALCIAAVEAILLAGMAFFILRVFDLRELFRVTNEVSREDSQFAFMIVVGIAATQLLANVGMKVNEGLQRSAINSVWQIGANVFVVCAVLVTIHLKLGLGWILLATGGVIVICNALNTLVTLIFLRPHLKPECEAINGDSAATLIRSGFIFFLLSVTTFIGIYLDPIVIARILGAEAVAEYAVVQRLSQIAIVFQAFLVALWPVYGEAFAGGDVAWIRTTFYRMLGASLLIGSLLGVAMIVLGPSFVSVWTQDSVKPSSGIFLSFAVYMVVSASIGSIATLLSLSAFLKYQLVLLVISSSLSLALKYWLASENGVSGIVWGTSIAFAICFVIPGYLIIRGQLFNRV